MVYLLLDLMGDLEVDLVLDLILDLMVDLLVNMLTVDPMSGFGGSLDLMMQIVEDVDG